jgi:uncharacterized protein YndB with AHSA1/START domain
LTVRARAKTVKLAGVGNDAVHRATGKGWDEWLRILDRAGARKMSHKEIALHLSRRCDVPDWWSQMVTVGYEQARGLRDVYQHADGYAANASRTIDVSVDRLYGAWNDPRARARWLPKAPVEVRRAVEGKSLRMAWRTGGSSVVVNFSNKGTGKSAVHVEQRKLASTAAVTRQKTYWSAALGRLKSLLEDER